MENGSEITIEPTKDATSEELQLFLIGSVFGALIHQRGMLPIHGSAVLFKGKAVVFTGVSGAGKSTLAMGLAQRGYSVLADDISVITKRADNTPVLYPGYPQMKLWGDSLDKLGKNSDDLKTVS